MLGKLLVLPLLMAIVGFVLGFSPVTVLSGVGGILFVSAGAIMALGALVAIVSFFESAAWRREID